MVEEPPRALSDQEALLVYMLACVDAGTATQFEIFDGGGLGELTARGRAQARRLVGSNAVARALYHEHLARELEEADGGDVDDE